MGVRQRIENGYVGAYWSWIGMKGRCKYPNGNSWRLYGGKGITVCERWQTFEHFLADMGPRPVGHTLDRIDSSKNYEPSNCRWATDQEQAINNTRKGMKYKPWSKETLANFNRRMKELAKVGKGPRSKKARKNQSLGQTGRVFSEETKAKISAAQKGRPHTVKHVKALKAAYKGKKGQQRRKRMAKLMKGRKFSEETRRKMSEAAKTRFVRDNWNPNPQARMNQ